MDKSVAMQRIRMHMMVHDMLESPKCQYITEALQMALHALGVIDQVRWERDVAFKQLEEIGIGFGQKIDGVYLTKEEHERLLEYKHMYEDLCK